MLSTQQASNILLNRKESCRFHLKRLGKAIFIRLKGAIGANIYINNEVCLPEVWNKILCPYLVDCRATVHHTISETNVVVTSMDVAQKIFNEELLLKDYLQRTHNNDTATLFINEDCPLTFCYKYKGLLDVIATWQIINQFGIPIRSQTVPHIQKKRKAKKNASDDTQVSIDW